MNNGRNLLGGGLQIRRHLHRASAEGMSAAAQGVAHQWESGVEVADTLDSVPTVASLAPGLQRPWLCASPSSAGAIARVSSTVSRGSVRPLLPRATFGWISQALSASPLSHAERPFGLAFLRYPAFSCGVQRNRATAVAGVLTGGLPLGRLGLSIMARLCSYRKSLTSPLSSYLM
jgi:hypothetical protein